MKKNYLSDLDKLKIVELYSQGISSTKIGKLYNTVPGNVLRYVKTRGGVVRDNSECQIKYNVDTNYFEEINTSNKAYTLGLFYADGYNNQQRGTIILNLQECDKHILDSIVTDMKYTGPLLFDIREFPRKNQYRLSVHRKKLSDDLANLGCIQRKSDHLKFPNLDQNLYRHFIRGFYDGDGWISLDSRYKGQIATFGIIGLENILIEIQNILSIYNIKCSLLSYSKGKYTNENIKYLQCTKREDLKRLYKFLYEDSELFLQRKFNTFSKFYSMSKT